MNAVRIAFTKQLRITSVTFRLTGAAWTFTEKKTMLDLHTQTYYVQT
jgi:hypothetical protein